MQDEIQVGLTSGLQTGVHVCLGYTDWIPRGMKAWIILRLSTHDSQLLHVVLLKIDLPNNASYENGSCFVTASSHLTKARPFSVFLPNTAWETKSPGH